VLLSACGGASPGTTSVTRAAAPSDTVWLCRPGLAGDPCTRPLTATVIGPAGVIGIQPAAPAASPPVDCFYVYPTVSEQPTANANLHIDPQETAVAVAQASPFSQVCRVFAPMYRQLTLRTILTPGAITRSAALIAYDGVRSAFRDYLAHDNHGRGIVFIGHSQGASLLIELLRQEVDHDPALRRRLVSAVILGGNVTVPVGRREGADFASIPACESTRQTGCVVAYSSFDRPPSPLAFFGRVTSGLDPFATATAAGNQVLCVNPAAPGGGAGALLTYLPTHATNALGFDSAGAHPVLTPWIEYPGEYRAHCESAGGASWLQIDRPGGSADRRPAVTPFEGPNWGLHVYDVNLALGNLVALVRSQAAAYRG